MYGGGSLTTDHLTIDREPQIREKGKLLGTNFINFHEFPPSVTAWLMVFAEFA